jgi:hypothetical protein
MQKRTDHSKVGDEDSSVHGNTSCRLVAERPHSAARPAQVSYELPETNVRAPVKCSGWILLMASMVTGRSLSPIVNGIAAKAGPNVDLSGVSMHANHEAGSGRPVATEA